MDESRRTIDGRTLLVLVRWAHILLDDSDNYFALEPGDVKELEAAVQNVKWAMERVQFVAPVDPIDAVLPEPAL